MSTPVIRWAGGKRQLLPQVLDAIGDVEGTYYEPFLGGGAVFLALEPKRAVLNDLNPALVNLYEVVRNDREALEQALDAAERTYNSLPDDEARRRAYLTARDAFNSPNGRTGIEGAARFIFLNKCGYNGLYRENSKGGFNTPWGHKEAVSLYSEDDLWLVSEALKNARLLCGDFEDACIDAEPGDTVFFDSPYDRTFDTYIGGGFSEADHRRLAGLFDLLTERGVRCVLTNSDTPLMRELYGRYDVRTVEVKRMINRDPNGRTGTEIIVTNGVEV